MSQDMSSLAGCSWTTSMLEPEAGEVLAAAWARYLAGNTGWLAYQGLPLPGAFIAPVSAEGTVIRYARAWITAGTYTAYAIYYGGGGVWTSQGTFRIDGTNIIGTLTQGNCNGTGTFILASDAWVEIAMISKSLSGAGTFSLSGWYRPCRT